MCEIAHWYLRVHNTWHESEQMRAYYREECYHKDAEARKLRHKREHDQRQIDTLKQQLEQGRQVSDRTSSSS